MCKLKACAQMGPRLNAHEFQTFIHDKPVPLVKMLKHILIQPPAEDTACNGLLKNYFYLKNGLYH